MKRLAVICLGLAIAGLSASEAVGWGSVHGPYGGAAYRGPMGSTAVVGPRSGEAYRGPYVGAARGPYGGAAVRGPYGGAAARGPYGGTAYRAPYSSGTVYRGGAYYGGATVVTPGVGAGVAAGVAVGAAAGAAAASSAYAAPSYSYYPSPYYYPPPTSQAAAPPPPVQAQQPTQAQIIAIRQACRADYQAHCATVPTGGAAALQCLQQNAQSVSAACQHALSAIGTAAR
jgi:hypothetical protein